MAADGDAAIKPALFSAPLDYETRVKTGADSLEELTVAELKDLAKCRGISGYSAMNKAQLTAVIQSAQSEG